MNPFRWSFRAQFLAGFLGCAALIAYAIYTQLYQGLEPCPLCIFQRIAYAALGLVFLVGGLHAPRGNHLAHKIGLVFIQPNILCPQRAARACGHAVLVVDNGGAGIGGEMAHRAFFLLAHGKTPW